jgi:LysM repeat protein
VKSRGYARFAAPAAFLAAVTIGVLLVRSGLEHGRHPAHPATTTGTTLTSARTHHTKKHHARTYTVQAGDTFDSIARKTGTTVARIEQLNPGIDPTALHVGQKIRVQ